MQQFALFNHSNETAFICYKICQTYKETLISTLANLCATCHFLKITK